MAEVVCTASSATSMMLLTLPLQVEAVWTNTLVSPFGISTKNLYQLRRETLEMPGYTRKKTYSATQAYLQYVEEQNRLLTQ